MLRVVPGYVHLGYPAVLEFPEESKLVRGLKLEESACLTVIEGFQPSCSFKILKQTVPEG